MPGAACVAQERRCGHLNCQSWGKARILHSGVGLRQSWQGSDGIGERRASSGTLLELLVRNHAALNQGVVTPVISAPPPTPFFAISFVVIIGPLSTNPAP